MESIGERLRQARKQQGITQAELARRAQVSCVLISKLERGERQSARLPTLARLAAALDAELTALVGTLESRPPEGDPRIAARLAEALATAQGLPAAAPPPATILYRYYDVDDLLLYVGIADRLAGRQRAHVAASSWMEFAARSTITRYPSRKDAQIAETTAIIGERPLFNFQYNNTPEARLRLVEYLIEHDRTDLLVPAVSRG